MKFVDTAGRVERFQRKFGAAQAAAQAAKDAKTAGKAAPAKK